MFEYRMSGIYVTSKIAHAPMWRNFQKNGELIVSRWINATVIDERVDNLRAVWQLIDSDMRKATGLLAYVRTGETLKGGVAEIAYAFAFNLPVIVVAPDAGATEMDFFTALRPSGTWYAHPNVRRAADLNTAFRLLR